MRADEMPKSGRGVTAVAASATLHCLTGCATGEILGLVLSTWWGWSNTGNVMLSVGLAFVFGYSLTMLPLLRGGRVPRQPRTDHPRQGTCRHPQLPPRPLTFR